MARKIYTAPCYEASLGSAIAWAIANNGDTHEIEVDGVFFDFDVTTQPEETETVYTGVTFMGDRESYLKTTYRATVKYNGAYTIHIGNRHYNPWEDEYDMRDADIELDMSLLAKSIEEENDDYSEFVITFEI